MKKSSTITAVCILAFVAVSFVFAHDLFVYQFRKRLKDRDEILTALMYSSSLSKIMETLSVVRAMANDQLLIEALESENSRTERQNVDLMQNYLSRMITPVQDAIPCVISDSSYRYYRNDGLFEVITPTTDPDDVWYLRFVAGDRNFNTTVWRDKNGPDGSLLFLNQAIKSDDKVLGIASIGIYVKDLLTDIQDLEQAYNVKIDLTDESGLVMLDSNYCDISMASLAYLVLPHQNGGERFYFHRYHGTGYVAVRWVSELGVFFVLRTEGKIVSFFSRHWYYLFALLLLIGSEAVFIICSRSIHRRRSIFPGSKTHVDSLTGLPNRNFFKDMYGERGVFNTTRYHSIAVFDIDFFKEANDNMNGDAALVSVVQHMLYVLNNHGMVLRWGGDEFLVLFELPLENAYTVCRQFCKNVAADNLVTVSVGVTEVRIADSIKKNYYRAAQYCYQVKEMGGNGVIKG
ncbi:MAG: GGDEF domain-containing protein [Treponema sp.]|nr:GGDEF domain-containing protein [Treponema sp.]